MDANTRTTPAIPWRRAARTTALVFALFFVQHYVRRFGQPFGDVYFTIIFDSIALTGLAMIAASYLLSPLAAFFPRCAEYRNLGKPFGLIGFALVVLHVVISLAALTPANFPKFFAEGGALSSVGELSVLAGAVGLAILSVIAVVSLPSVGERMGERAWLLVQRSGLVAVALAVIHFGVFKWRGWLTFDSWINYLPSGTFVVTAFILFVFVMRFAAFLAQKSRRPQ